ncbi:hypothetical protein WKW80_19895 [Variovorax humicola]|uniref:Lipoprotein n=1 Tax=Variovorax humicola TaxID=1769758 RepID=A0ABU8W2J8_9BURK
MRFPRFSILVVVACLLAACGAAPRGANPGNEGAGTSSGHSGVEVFGTMDAAVSNYRNR